MPDYVSVNTDNTIIRDETKKQKSQTETIKNWAWHIDCAEIRIHDDVFGFIGSSEKNEKRIWLVRMRVKDWGYLREYKCEKK